MYGSSRYDSSRLRGNPENLTGLLLIIAQDVETNMNHFKLASQEPEKLFHILRYGPREFEEKVRGDFNYLMKKIGVKVKLELSGCNPPNVIYVVQSTLEFLPQHATFPQILDLYSIGIVQNQGEFKEISQDIVDKYFLDYNLQHKPMGLSELLKNSISLRINPNDPNFFFANN